MAMLITCLYELIHGAYIHSFPRRIVYDWWPVRRVDAALTMEYDMFDQHAYNMLIYGAYILCLYL